MKTQKLLFENNANPDLKSGLAGCSNTINYSLLIIN